MKRVRFFLLGFAVMLAGSTSTLKAASDVEEGFRAFGIVAGTLGLIGLVGFFSYRAHQRPRRLQMAREAAQVAARVAREPTEVKEPLLHLDDLRSNLDHALDIVKIKMDRLQLRINESSAWFGNTAAQEERKRELDDAKQDLREIKERITKRETWDPRSVNELKATNLSPSEIDTIVEAQAPLIDEWLKVVENTQDYISRIEGRVPENIQPRYVERTIDPIREDSMSIRRMSSSRGTESFNSDAPAPRASGRR